MGVEIIYPIVWLFSLVAMVWLVIRSLRSDTRPYALPTLLLSVVVALSCAWAHREPGYFIKYALWCFAPAVLLLGIHAHAILWLAKRRGANSEP
jgi:hypothetical protein